MDRDLPVAVIGGGPVGLAAAAHLIARGLPVRVYEAGAAVGASVRDWGHVRLFSPWEFNVDPAARDILERQGWRAPPDGTFPTGRDLVDLYLVPLSTTPEMEAVVETGARIVAVARAGLDKVASRGRERRPFALSVVDRAGRKRRDLARAVIDASGTWTIPNPVGGDGLPTEGEAALAGRIAYGIPDVLGRDRALHARRTTLVLGAGHSAANVLLDLVRLAEAEPGTEAVWVSRSTDLSRVYGGGAADRLPARGDLGARLQAGVDGGRIAVVTGLSATDIREKGGRLHLDGDTAAGRRSVGPVDRIVAATGQRPDLALLRELRLDLDPWLESARALGPMIDPNLHYCGSVPPHGHRELSHPEPGFYTVGVKSYGRAPTFLMMTGYEQVRSVAAALAGDLAAADDVRLVLPETGVCSLPTGEAAQESEHGTCASEGRPPDAAPPSCCGKAA